MSDPRTSTFAPGAFFDLQGFEHAALFADNEPVWAALGRIRAHLAAWLAEHGARIDGDVAARADLVGDDIHIAAGARVEPGAYVRGPCIIGAGTEVRHGAYLRGGVIVGANCVVGHATEAKNSIFLDGAKAGHFAYVGDSILGRDANLGAGTKLANLRLDDRTVWVRAGAERVDTGRRKLGAILGDRAQLGCNSVTNPGTLLGPDSRVWPCVATFGYHPAGSVLGTP